MSDDPIEIDDDTAAALDRIAEAGDDADAVADELDADPEEFAKFLMELGVAEQPDAVRLLAAVESAADRAPSQRSVEKPRIARVRRQDESSERLLRRRVGPTSLLEQPGERSVDEVVRVVKELTVHIRTLMRASGKGGHPPKGPSGIKRYAGRGSRSRLKHLKEVNRLKAKRQRLLNDLKRVDAEVHKQFIKELDRV